MAHGKRRNYEKRSMEYTGTEDSGKSNRLLITGVTIILVVVLVVAAFLYLSPAKEPYIPDGGGASEPILITASNFAFDPSTISVNQGDTVKLKINATEGSHRFAIDELGIDETLLLNQESIIEFTATSSGSFAFYCPVSNHRSLGMEGVLTVKEDNTVNLETGIGVGKLAPNFSLTDIDGNGFSLNDYRGNVVVIDLMATWCGPCITEMGHLKNIYSDYYSQGVRIMSIDVDDTETVSQLRSFKNSYGDDWIFATDGGAVGQTYQATGIPKMFIIDKQGVVAYSNTGITPYSTLAIEIDKLL